MVTAITDPSFQGLRFTAHDIRRFEVALQVVAPDLRILHPLQRDHPRSAQRLHPFVLTLCLLDLSTRLLDLL